MNKLFILMFVMVLLIGSVSALDFDNVLTYKENDMKVTFDNAFNLPLIGSELGTIELKSHKTIDEVLQFGYGAEEIVMYYDFTNWELYSNGLGDVKFIDMKTGKEIQKDYSFVEWTSNMVEVNDYQEICSLSKNQTSTCSQNIIGTHLEERWSWEEYVGKDIPNRDIRIGLKTFVDKNDYIDAVWTIAGKEVTKHASWTSALNVGLVSYYNFEQSGGVLEDVVTGVNNGTVFSATYNTTGFIGSARTFDNTNDYIDISSIVNNSLFNGDFSISVWAKLSSTSSGSNDNVYGAGEAATTNWKIQVAHQAPNWIADVQSGSKNSVNNGSTYDDLDWHHFVLVVDSDSHINGFYIDGELAGSDSTFTQAIIPTAFFIGQLPFSSANVNPFAGDIDEMGIWNRTVSQSEVTQLYNGGVGITHTAEFTPEITLNSPIDNFGSSIPTIDFNATVITDGEDLINVTFYLNDIENETNSSGIEGNYIFSRTFSEQTSTWLIQACNPLGCVNSSSRTFTVDLIVPTIDLFSPNETFNYLREGRILNLTGFANDTNLDTCWSEYNNINTTFSCTTATLFNESITQLDINNLSLTLWANDTAGSESSKEVAWSYKIFENNRTLNSTSFETKSETFILNVTANSSLSAITLDYNGTEYSTTQSGTTYSRTLDIPEGVYNNSVRWKATYAGDNIYTDYSYQDVALTNFSICDGSLTDDFLNISFKDEDDLAVINASIPTSTFVYYLGSGTSNKTYTYVNTGLNYNYTFCAIPTTETFTVDSVVQYKQGSDYPQRIWNPDVISYTSSVTDKILYLLNSLDGLFVTFQVINAVEQGISGVDVTAIRTIGSEDVTVAQGSTDAAGAVTFWLNPDFSHTITFTKDGFDTASTTLVPTQSTYTITLTGGTTSGAIDYTQGISISTRPVGFVLNETLYNFNYTISSNFWVLEEFGFTLSYSNGTTIGTQTSTTNTGGTIGLDALTGSNGSMVMNYYYLINSTYTNATASWVIYKSNAFSISHFFERVVTYIDADIFGVQSDDEGEFFKAILSVFILITVAGVLSSRYGIASEQAVSGIIFGVLLMLNTLNLIPTPAGTTFQNLGDFLVGLVGFIMLVSVFKEESR